ncbi:MAG: GTPase HflX [Lachnospiraceae bacterium]|nr:GTPase HflX [Lachnospiraceae bacterium]MBQ9123125.1 GTPase HflX [Lachnospiraceae bacterium]
MEFKRRALLVGVDTGEEEEFETSMEELANLAKACDMEVVGIITQKLEAIHKALYIGKGKVAETREFAKDMEADLVIFDNALSPSQMRNLQQELDLEVMDRTGLILDIFSERAKTREAKLQVETAKLQYMLPRLVGLHDALGRQGGASGSLSNKGAGEKKIELDRRKIEHRISELRKELEEVSRERETQRQKRVKSAIPRVSLVGYTNAGKSTLLNTLVERFIGDESKKVFEKDMVFATLETSVRLIDTQEARPFYLADTVGFIHKLPHGLIKAFRSTLDEVKQADLLLHVVDYSDEHHKQHIKVTEETLKDMEAGGIPVIYVYNKADKVMDKLPHVVNDQQIFMSAKNGQGIEELLKLICDKLYADNKEVKFLIPYDKGSILSYLLEKGKAVSQEYVADGVRLVINCQKRDYEKYKEYIVEEFID